MGCEGPLLANHGNRQFQKVCETDNTNYHKGKSSYKKQVCGIKSGSTIGYNPSSKHDFLLFPSLLSLCIS